MLRAFAHPPRSRLLPAPRAYGSATSTRRAQRLSTNSVATSYRLRNLGGVTSWAEKDLLQVILRYRAAGPESGRDIQRVMVLLDSFPSPQAAV